MTYKPKDPVFLIADNANWKVKHGQKGGTVESWTLVAHRFPEEEKELDDHYGENPLSRDPSKYWTKDYLDAMDVDEVVRKVFLVSDNDCKELLARSTALEAKQRLSTQPSVEWCNKK